MATRAVEASAAGHGAEPRGKRTDQGEATYLVAIAEALWEEMERTSGCSCSARTSACTAARSR